MNKVLSIPNENNPELFRETDSQFFCVVDDITGEVDDLISHDFLLSIIGDSGELNGRGIDYFGFSETPCVDEVPEGTFYGGQQLSFIPPISFRGGSQLHYDETLGGPQPVDEKIEKHELSYLRLVLDEIFDGRSDMAEVDKEYLLNPDSGMPQTLRSLFINKPGQNGGKSSLRHIFRGDKSKGIPTGLHVPAFVEEFNGDYNNTIDQFSPFEARVIIDGVSKLRVIKDTVPRIEPAMNSMFPIALDSLAVIQCIIDAWEHKGDSDYIYLSKRGDVSNVYEVPVAIDEATKPMKIRLITDSNTHEEKIRTAFPIVEAR